MKKEKLYRCDPDLNLWCPKTNCYRRYPDCCRRTNEKQYKMNIFKRIKEKIFEICNIDIPRVRPLDDPDKVKRSKKWKLRNSKK